MYVTIQTNAGKTSNFKQLKLHCKVKYALKLDQSKVYFIKVYLLSTKHCSIFISQLYNRFVINLWPFIYLKFY